MATHEQFTEALRRARLAEAAHLDAIANVRDARALRLTALREQLLPALKGHPQAESFQELNIQPGDTPRLWIDLISSVVIEPDLVTYRLVQEQESKRAILHETADLDEMARTVLKYIAHRVLARERLQAVDTPQLPPEGYSLGELVYVWFTGAALGALLLLIAAILLGILHF